MTRFCPRPSPILFLISGAHDNLDIANLPYEKKNKDSAGDRQIITIYIRPGSWRRHRF